MQNSQSERILKDKVYKNGQKTHELSDNKLTYFYKNGKVKAEGIFENEQSHGEWIFYRETGQLWQVGNFQNGKKNGIWIRYDRNNQLEYKEEFADDKRLLKKGGLTTENLAQGIETINMDEDIKVLCVTATSFPDGILEAHQKLHAQIPFSKNRRYFGISRPEKAVLVYKAAAEDLEKEAEEFIGESFIIEKGKYLSLTILKYLEDLQRIGKAFEELIAYPNIDPSGYCIEWYYNETDVKCMVRLKD